jgi:hypothetical protein
MLTDVVGRQVINGNRTADHPVDPTSPDSIRS